MGEDEREAVEKGEKDEKAFKKFVFTQKKDHKIFFSIKRTDMAAPAADAFAPAGTNAAAPAPMAPSVPGVGASTAPVYNSVPVALEIASAPPVAVPVASAVGSYGGNVGTVVAVENNNNAARRPQNGCVNCFVVVQMICGVIELAGAAIGLLILLFSPVGGGADWFKVVLTLCIGIAATMAAITINPCGCCVEPSPQGVRWASQQSLMAFALTVVYLITAAAVWAVNVGTINGARVERYTCCPIQGGRYPTQVTAECTEDYCVRPYGEHRGSSPGDCLGGGELDLTLTCDVCAWLERETGESSQDDDDGEGEGFNCDRDGEKLAGRWHGVKKSPAETEPLNDFVKSSKKQEVNALGGLEVTVTVVFGIVYAVTGWQTWTEYQSTAGL